KLAAMLILLAGVLGIATGLPASMSPAEGQETAGEVYFADPPPGLPKKSAKDELVLSIDQKGNLTGPGQKEPLIKPAEIQAYLKAQYQQADKAAKAKGGIDSKVTTTVRIDVHREAEYFRVATVLKQCYAVGYNKLQLQGIGVPIEPAL